MAQIPASIERKIRDYIKSLQKEINIAGAFLFGSYAKSQWSPESDIDIAVFSDFFAHKTTAEAIAFLLQRALVFDLDIQPVAFDAQDLERYQDNPFVRQIVTGGIRLV